MCEHSVQDKPQGLTRPAPVAERACSRHPGGLISVTLSLRRLQQN